MRYPVCGPVFAMPGDAGLRSAMALKRGQFGGGELLPPRGILIEKGVRVNEIQVLERCS